jgi:NAD(P)-dependent dehydrogenase (short-subunit alcohol dehydrogenase family)
MSWLDEKFGLDGKTVVITGGSGVLAGSMAGALVRAGASVSLWGRHAETLQEAAQRAGSAAGGKERIDWVMGDAFNESSMSDAVRATVERFGSLDVLINAVGGNRSKTAFVDTDTALFEEVLKLNLVAGLMVPTKVVCRWWIEKKAHGSIINLASMSSYVPLSGVWAYDAAKAGVLNLTMAAAKEFAPHGIRVNAIAPGYIMTELIEWMPEEHRAKLMPRIPMRRFGSVEEVAKAAAFLIEDATYTTGQTLVLDGGILVD